MKKIITCIAAILFSAVAWGQVSNPSIIPVVSAPSGACSQVLPDQQTTVAGVIYTCQSGTWTAIGSGGGGGVSSFTGDGALLSNSASTGAVTATLGTAAAQTWWGNPTGSTATPAYNTLPLYLDWTFNSGAAATDASPRFLASHTATIANCYVLTTASDGSTALTFNIFDNGTTIFTSGAQTVAAATSPGTLTTISGLSITSITNNDKMSINITSGTSSWVFTVACK